MKTEERKTKSERGSAPFKTEFYWLSPFSPSESHIPRSVIVHRSYCDFTVIIFGRASRFETRRSAALSIDRRDVTESRSLKSAYTNANFDHHYLIAFVCSDSMELEDRFNISIKCKKKNRKPVTALSRPDFRLNCRPTIVWPIKDSPLLNGKRWQVAAHFARVNARTRSKDDQL